MTVWYWAGSSFLVSSYVYFLETPANPLSVSFIIQAQSLESSPSLAFSASFSSFYSLPAIFADVAPASLIARLMRLPLKLPPLSRRISTTSILPLLQAWDMGIRMPATGHILSHHFRTSSPAMVHTIHIPALASLVLPVLVLVDVAYVAEGSKIRLGRSPIHSNSTKCKRPSPPGTKEAFVAAQEP
jgi:hypothetical protein